MPRHALLMSSRPHYGWVIAAVLFVCFTLSVGIIQYSFGVFVTPLEQEFGWTRAQVNGSLSFFATTGVLALLSGPVLDRFGSGPVMVVSFLAIALSFLLRPWMSDLWHFYALNLLMYAGMPGAIMLPVGKLIGIWFIEGRGRAIGLTAMGANFGGFIFSSQTETLIDAFDWQTTYFIFGLMFLVLVPLIILTIRETPRAPSHAPVGGQPAPQLLVQVGMAAAAALRTRAFILVCVGLLLATITYQSVLSQIFPHLESVGISRTEASWAVGILAIFGMVGKVLLGYLTEKFPARYVFVGSLWLQVLGILILVFAGASPLFWLFVPIFGVAFGGMGSLITLIIQDTFGIKAFATIFGMVNFFILPTPLLGPLLVGKSFEDTGAYTVAFLVISVLLIIGSIAFYFARPPRWDKTDESDTSRDLAHATG